MTVLEKLNKKLKGIEHEKRLSKDISELSYKAQEILLVVFSHQDYPDQKITVGSLINCTFEHFCNDKNILNELNMFLINLGIDIRKKEALVPLKRRLYWILTEYRNDKFCKYMIKHIENYDNTKENNHENS